MHPSNMTGSLRTELHDWRLVCRRECCEVTSQTVLPVRFSGWCGVKLFPPADKHVTTLVLPGTAGFYETLTICACIYCRSNIFYRRCDVFSEFSAYVRYLSSKVHLRNKTTAVFLHLLTVNYVRKQFYTVRGCTEQEGAVKRRTAGDRLHTSNFSVR